MFAEHWPASLLLVMLAGQVMVGFSESFTAMVCEHDVVLPDWSVAVQVMVVVPIG